MSVISPYPLDGAFNRAVVEITHRLVPRYLVSDDAPSTFRQLKAHLDAGKTLVVAKEGSDHTIFADPAVNCAFRAWHDWSHWTGNYDFSLYGESATCSLMIDHLYRFMGVTSETQKWSRYLIAEIIGQRQYYEKYRAYIENQRAFVTAYVASPTKALSRRW